MPDGFKDQTLKIIYNLGRDWMSSMMFTQLFYNPTLKS